ncbi:hypothetical protein DB346_06010 [Verrucomicrobia bacterium LW23]|nr:hypothetical protein DB346_06010 [Verrucomicrobia bacterium LW23]
MASARPTSISARCYRLRRRGFTLVELLVSLSVLVVLLLLINRLMASALQVTGTSQRRMEADTQARAVFERLAIDFGQMLRRPDVDYILKDATRLPQPGNDQMAFFSRVPGYSTTPAAPPSQMSLVAYRVNSDSSSPYVHKLQRLGWGLPWNAAGTETPLVYRQNATSYPPNSISTNWSSAVDMSEQEHYELAGPQVFRLEYYYLIKGATVYDATTASVVTLPSRLSATPWDTRPPLNHTAVDGLRDVAAIVVTIAILDPGSRIKLTQTQLAQLVTAMPDFNEAMLPGELEERWQQAAQTAPIPAEAASAVRIYQRYFHLTPVTP